MARFAPDPTIHDVIHGRLLRPGQLYYGYRRISIAGTWTPDNGKAGSGGGSHEYEFIVDKMSNEWGEVCPLAPVFGLELPKAQLKEGYQKNMSDEVKIRLSAQQRTDLFMAAIIVLGLMAGLVGSLYIGSHWGH